MWEYPTKNEWILSRLLNYISYPFFAFFAWLFKKTDYIYATPPSSFISMLWYVLSWLKRKPLILDVRDLWPESVAAVWVINKDSFVYKMLLKVSHRIYMSADIVIANSEWNQRVLEEIIWRKVYLIKNAVTDKIFVKDTAKAKEFEWKFLITYTWNHSNAQELENIIFLAKDISNFDEDFHFLLIWDWESKKKLLKMVAKENITNVSFYDYMEVSKINNVLNYSDIWIFSLNDNKTFNDVMPSKIYEYMKLWLPIVWFWEGTVKEFINWNKLWLCVSKDDRKTLINYIMELKEDSDYCNKTSKISQEYVKKHLSFDGFQNKWKEIMKSLN